LSYSFAEKNLDLTVSKKAMAALNEIFLDFVGKFLFYL